MLRRVFAVVALVVGVGWLGTAEAGEAYRLIRLDGGFMKWGLPELGTGATVTYAIAAAPRLDAAARNCGALAPLAPLLAKNDVPMERFLAELQAAVALWEAAADLRFLPARDPATAQILIGAQATPRGRAFANVDYAPAVKGDVHRLRQSLICLNPAIPWKIGFGGDGGTYDLRYTLTHELGHAVGLDHPGATRGQVMSFRYDEDSRGLGLGDIAGVRRLYGTPMSVADALLAAETREPVADRR